MGVLSCGLFPVDGLFAFNSRSMRVDTVLDDLAQLSNVYHGNLPQDNNCGSSRGGREDISKISISTGRMYRVSGSSGARADTVPEPGRLLRNYCKEYMDVLSGKGT